jgi:arginine decarboxylase
LQSKLDLTSRAHRDIQDELNEKLADKVFLNFSLFQSIPDAWGIDQVFP